MSGLASPHYRDLWLDCLSERDIAKRLAYWKKLRGEHADEAEDPA
jgi:hypothetical protein